MCVSGLCKVKKKDKAKTKKKTAFWKGVKFAMKGKGEPKPEEDKVSGKTEKAKGKEEEEEDTVKDTAGKLVRVKEEKAGRKDFGVVCKVEKAFKDGGLVMRAEVGFATVKARIEDVAFLDTLSKRTPGKTLRDLPRQEKRLCLRSWASKV